MLLVILFLLTIATPNQITFSFPKVQNRDTLGLPGGFWQLEDCRCCLCETSMCSRHSSSQLQWTHHRTQLSSPERRGAAPGPRAGDPLQPVEDHHGAGTTLQPLETPCCSRWMCSEGSCRLWRTEIWKKLASGQEYTQEQVFWICGLWGPHTRAIHS